MEKKEREKKKQNEKNIRKKKKAKRIVQKSKRRGNWGREKFHEFWWYRKALKQHSTITPSIFNTASS